MRRAFSDAFKREAVDRVTGSHGSLPEVATQLGLNQSVLRRWITELGPQDTGTPAIETELGQGPQRALGERKLELAGLIETFVALAQTSRWELFLLLLRAGPAGLTSGTIKQQFGLRPTAISAHLRVLEQAKLIKVVPDSRKVSANWGKGVATFTVNLEHLTYLLGVTLDEFRKHAPDILNEALNAVLITSADRGGARQPLRSD